MKFPALPRNRALRLGALVFLFGLLTWGNVSHVNGAPAGRENSPETDPANYHSTSDGERVTVQFVNGLDEPLAISWINYEGGLRAVGNLQPGEAIGQDTFTAHPFFFEGQTSGFRQVLYPPSEGGPVYIARYREMEMLGWSLHINETLYDNQKEALTRALELLEGQFERVIETLPANIVSRLREVPVWINPPPKDKRPGAAYHPNIQWLKDSGRNPAMAKAVELTNVSIFPFENRRMPALILHELAHAYHDQVLGFDNPEIIAAFNRASESGLYENVDRYTGEKIVRDRSYALTNHKEYFAESTEAYFLKNDFFPFNREELKTQDPVMFALLEKIWRGPEPVSAPVSGKIPGN